MQFRNPAELSLSFSTQAKDLILKAFSAPEMTCKNERIFSDMIQVVQASLDVTVYPNWPSCHHVAGWP